MSENENVDTTAQEGAAVGEATEAVESQEEGAQEETAEATANAGAEGEADAANTEGGAVDEDEKTDSVDSVDSVDSKEDTNEDEAADNADGEEQSEGDALEADEETPAPKVGTAVVNSDGLVKTVFTEEDHGADHAQKAADYATNGGYQTQPWEG